MAAGEPAKDTARPMRIVLLTDNASSGSLLDSVTLEADHSTGMRSRTKRELRACVSLSQMLTLPHATNP